ncbi:hypothetical protein Glove_87g186 [Diversispora epigaea]|uniref:Uncharacterized protein n=1 Tax=Diversispora epigaea TaxID=1348612 RepID=A0A397J6A0_9GLOM|nr:hypothetical protein Glove_87g186 [Diversispora epigaea]
MLQSLKDYHIFKKSGKYVKNRPELKTIIDNYEIFGVYNPLAWDNSIGDCNMKTNDSFIFSLKNGNNQNSILSRVINNIQAL